MGAGFVVKPPFTSLSGEYAGCGCIAAGLRKNRAFSDLCVENEPPDGVTAGGGGIRGRYAGGGTPSTSQFLENRLVSSLSCLPDGQVALRQGVSISLLIHTEVFYSS